MEHKSPCQNGSDFAVQIDEVLTTPTSIIKDCGLDAPEQGDTNDIHALTISGWITAKKRIQYVDVMWSQRLLRRIEINQASAGLKTQLRRLLSTSSAGFACNIGTLGLPPHFEIQLHAVPAGSQKTDSQSFATLRGRRNFLCLPDEAKIQPLLLTGLGRSGTTWVMHLLAQQPEIALFRQYPYESRMAVYSMQMLKVLSEPGNPGCLNRDIATRDSLQTIGPNPYYDRPEMNYPLLRLHCGRTQAEQLGEYCRQNIDQWYEKLAASQQQTAVKYFAEKAVPNHVPWLLRELYPEIREVILVRDFRDLIASAFAFNAKRGFLAFGRNRVKSDTEYITLIQQRADEVLKSWRQRSHQVHLLRYEDLIQNTEVELTRLFQYLLLDSSPQRVQSTLERARQDSSELQYHRTSANPQSSIGRWKRDLSPKLQKVCERELGSILSELGYEV